MKKVLVLCLMGSLAFFILVCGDGPNETQAQEQVGPLPRYGFESDYMSLTQIGELLERMGREIQQNGAVRFMGNTYPLGGHGGIEFSLNRRTRPGMPPSTGFQMDVGSDGTSDPPTPRPNREGKAYSIFEGPGIQGTTAEVADAIDALASELESSGTFTWDFHTGEFVGTAIIDHYLSQNTRNPRQPVRYNIDIAFGEGEFERHDDREDFAELEESGRGVWLGNSSVEGADQGTVVETLRALGSALRDGQLAVGEGRAAFGDSVSFNLGHVGAFDGSSEKIEMGLGWPTLPPPPPQPRPEPDPNAPASYYDEEFTMPMTDLAEMLQRIAAEILEDGTFVFDGEEYTVGENAGGEIGFRASGMTIDIGWRR